MQAQVKSETKSELETQYFERPEGTLAYTDYGGDGELVIMLPGMASLRSEYRYLAPMLREAGYHAVAVDLRGQGDSSVPWKTYDVPAVGNDILALIDHLDAGPAHVIANSYSPAPAIWASVERNEAIRSLVLIAAFAQEIKYSLFMKAAMWFMANNPWRVKTWRMYYRTLFPTRKPADFETYLDALSANLAEPGRFDAATALPAAPRQPWIERLDRVSVPVLSVMGTKDPDFPDPHAAAQYLADRVKGELAMIDGAGHYPQSEMPEATAQAVLAFWGRV